MLEKGTWITESNLQKTRLRPGLDNMTCPGLRITLGFTQGLSGKESTGSAADTGDAG